MSLKTHIKLACLGLALPFAGCAGDTNMFPDSPPSTIGSGRTAQLVYPEDYTPKRAWPVALVLHGYTGNAAEMIDGFDLEEYTTSHGFVALVPQGTTDANGHPFWNAAAECCDFFETGVDDVAYIRKLLEDLKLNVNVDADRISLLGSSNGGFFSYRLICDLPGIFNQLISIAGAAAQDAGACTAAQPVHAIQIHGTVDTIVSYTNNVGTKDDDIFGVLGVETIGAPESAERMQALNGCDPDVSSAEQFDFINSLAGSETTATTWTECTSGKTVELWTFNQTDHVIPLVANAAFFERLAEKIVER